MSRIQVRAAVRPDVRRVLLTGFAVAVASLGWASLAFAQEGSAGELNSAASVVAIQSEPAPSAPTILSSQTEKSAPVGPVLTASAVSFVPSADRQVSSLDERMQERRVGLGRNIALIAVGVAAMVIGSEVDDAPGTLLVIGGAGMTLYGLYNLLR